MHSATEQYYAKRGEILVKNLKSRHFDAYYCKNRESALEKVLELIPKGSSIGWGGCLTAEQMGLFDAIRGGDYRPIDRFAAATPEGKEAATKEAMFADVFLTGANALSMDGQMVNVDGTGNRVAALIYGPKSVIVVAGMNKVMDSLEDAITRARTVAAPMNKQRFPNVTPCAATGVCGDCKAEGCICNQIVITRHCRPVGRIKFVLIGEDMGM